MNEDEKKKLGTALRQLAGSIAILPLFFLAIWGLGSRGIINFNNSYVGYIASMLMIPVLIQGARALTGLFDLLVSHFKLHLDGNNLLIGILLCLIGTGVIRYVKEGGFAMIGAVMLIGGLWILCKSVGTAFVLYKDGETIYAEITDITHSSPGRSGGITYTVICRAGDRIYRGKTNAPMDMSCIGKKVAVSVSKSQNDIYFVDLSRFFPNDPENGGSDGPETEPEIEPDTADGSAAPPQPERTEEVRAPEITALPPMDWKTTRKKCLKIPYAKIILLTVVLLYDSFLINRIQKGNGGMAYLYLITLALSIWLLIVVLDQVRRYWLLRFGRQVRATVHSAGYTRRSSGGDPIYKVTCRAGDEIYSGKLQLRLEDPDLPGKCVTVFVSRRFPTQYIIEGSTLSDKT